MKFHEFGDPDRPAVMLVHGGGSAWWNFLRQARALAGDYRVVLPTLDGHGEEAHTPYVSTEASADKLLDYIDTHCGGRLFALGGVSLGGQVVIELLSRRPDLADKAIIDGALCFPTPGLQRFCLATIRLAGPLMFNPVAARLQLGLMGVLTPEDVRFPNDIREHYLRDMSRLPQATLIAMYRTYMSYNLKPSLKDSRAEVSYWYGEREMAAVKESAERFRRYLPATQIVEAKGCSHGELAVYRPERWLRQACAFFAAATSRGRHDLR